MLMLPDREEISRGLAEGLSYKDIASVVGRDPSVISREVRRHGGRRDYRAAAAQGRAEASRGRPKQLAVDRHPRLRGLVHALLRRGWSPASIAGRLPIDYRDDQACRVSHEAIYQWIYATPVSTLARELLALRSGRTTRRGGHKPPPAPRITGPIYIDARPAEADDRAVPGHWEGDLVIGKAGKTAVATLVERTSRFLVLVPLHGRDALTVGRGVIAATHALPEHMRASLTWDCGAEMAGHATVTKGSMPVYFAHPHSPWERGSNENLNRIVREYFPKGVAITSDPKYLAMVASDINDRPRKIHNWKKPSEVFAELVELDASTA
ncbi:IS30 family transposase [Microbacterium sp. HSID17254]|uniref:IS30 family transposase n=1 Tax=Microbacterium sp. HSID17254 TaxID=2419509 RepID=UPI000F98A153|nr:IS30 family transposase [Microbacterium sp. HSID17254]RUQ02738.1 IS30 family transposase [Microbacterium sp. HSID17254]